MKNKTDNVLDIIGKTVEKVKEAKVLCNKYNIDNQDKFIATNILDYILTQVPIETIQDYKEYRGKGWV